MPANFESSRRGNAPVHPEWSGKMFVLFRLMREMRRPGNGNDKIVIVSNYTQTLDLIGRMCRENTWGFCRLDGSISMKKRQKMVDEFNDPSSSLVAFLLSSKAGGCGLNLIGGNRLVLFDPDWNPAVDKQAAARCWRDGQKKRCFTYRFLATGTVEEKIFQRQLSKEGLQSVVDDKEQVNALSTKDLRNLFKLRAGTPSDTHDKLRCERCEIIQDNAEMEALKKLPKQLVKCRELLDQMVKQEDSAYFLKPMNPQDHGTTTEEFEKIVKQPMDFGTIRTRLAQALAAHQPQTEQDQGTAPAANVKQSSGASTYKNISAFSKDVNRIFSNCLKVWEPEKDAVADAARRLQTWWIQQWTELVPVLMIMKAEDDEKPNEKMDEADSDILGSAAINNERGENFQEQLGMPDEENMRSWSHHNSTDTVDDPVFRAAMRGFDSVSFVFGLEVTWSLIQQRQQEEEERRAMQELQVVQELNGEDDDEEEEDSSGKTDNEDKDSTDEDSDSNEKVAEDDDDNEEEEEEAATDHQEEGDGEEESSGEIEEDDSESDEDGQQSEADESAEAPEAELEASEPEDQVEENEPESRRSKRSPSTPPSTGKENKAHRGMWACEVCTVHNDSNAMLCKVCESAKPSPEKKKRR